jgi:hypothetical protein
MMSLQLDITNFSNRIYSPIYSTLWCGYSWWRGVLYPYYGGARTDGITLGSGHSTQQCWRLNIDDNNDATWERISPLPTIYSRQCSTLW